MACGLSQCACDAYSCGRAAARHTSRCKLGARNVWQVFFSRARARFVDRLAANAFQVVLYHGACLPTVGSHPLGFQPLGLQACATSRPIAFPELAPPSDGNPASGCPLRWRASCLVYRSATDAPLGPTEPTDAKQFVRVLRTTALSARGSEICVGSQSACEHFRQVAFLLHDLVIVPYIMA